VLPRTRVVAREGVSLSGVAPSCPAVVRKVLCVRVECLILCLFVRA